jgi:uncharacterized protein YcfJ
LENKMIKKLVFTFGLLAALPAAAHEDYDMAEVVSVSPRYVAVSQPRQECWNETVRDGYSTSRSNAGAIIGGIAGGILGNQVGGGSGRTAATAAGAITGAIVGDRLDNDRHAPATRTVRRCRTVEHAVRAIRDYDVAYRYDGRIMTTVLQYDPGYTIRIPVTRRVVYVVDDDNFHHDRGLHRGWYKDQHQRRQRHFDD